MLVVDRWHWLTEEGDFLYEKPRLYRRMLRIARFIEYGGELQKSQTRETLVECKRRPVGKACLGLIWVMKTADDDILASCLVCKTDEVLVYNCVGGGRRPRPGLRYLSMAMLAGTPSRRFGSLSRFGLCPASICCQ